MCSPQNDFKFMIQNQRDDITKVGNYDKLSFQDIKRLDTYIHGNIFQSKHCCLYSGEIKNKYSTISFNRKKVSVLRLLYHNYVNDIELNDKLEYTCENAGVCCNLNHFKVKNKEHKINIKKSYVKQYEIKPFEDPNLNQDMDEEDVFTLE